MSSSVFSIQPRRPIRSVRVTADENMLKIKKTLETENSHNGIDSESESDIEESSDIEASSDIELSNINNITKSRQSYSPIRTQSQYNQHQNSPSKQYANQKSLSPSPIRNRKGKRKENKNIKDKITLESNLEQQTYNNNTFDYTYIIKFSLIIFIILIYFSIPNSPAKSKIQLNKKTECSFNDLRKSFPNQNDNLWDTITYGIEGILNNNPAKPGVYLFLHENYDLTRELIEKIANISSNCFDPNLKPIKMETQDFITNDYGTIIENYRKNIKNGGVLIVANLNEIPPESAKALHTICDSYSPIVDKVIIFLTLTVNSDEKGKPLEIAENKLNHLWRTIERNELEPLISRVTDSVILLK